jgi:hypothetical protein
MKGSVVFIFGNNSEDCACNSQEAVPDCDVCLVRQIPHAWVRRNGWPSISSKILPTGEIQGLGNLCISLGPRTLKEIGRTISF